MPKEYIYSNEFFPETSDNPHVPVVVKVTWAREEAGGHVQMTVFKKDNTYESEHELPMYWTPTRRDINELIRILRRARDQAFGKDE